MLNRFFDILVNIRNFLFSIFNKEFLIFLFFLMLSSVYWVMSVLNDTMEREVTIPVHLVNVPKNIIILGDSSLSVRATVRDKGYAIFTYFHGDRIKPVNVPFDLYARTSEKLTLTAAEMAKLVKDMLYGSTRVVSIKPDKLEIPFNFGQKKKVPVKLLGDISTSDKYYLARVQFDPDTVYIYSTPHILDSIHIAYTEKQNFHDVNDTITKIVNLKKILGAKAVPSTVKMTLYTDIMTEAETMVPITPVNVPDGMMLRMFPSQVSVRYVVGASQYKSINEADFKVEADYNSTDGGQTNKCQLRLVRSPRLVRNPTLSISETDYLVEQ